MAFYEVYKKLCAQKGVSASRASLEMGFSNSTATYWAHGSVPKIEAMHKIAEYFGVDVSVLLEDSKREEPAPITSRALGALIMMPVIGSVKAGYGSEAVEEYTGEYQYIGADMVKNMPQEYRVLQVTGDSMYPFFLEGDKVVVHLQPEAESGETVVAILASGDGTIKKLRINSDGSRELIPSNAMYPPIKLGADDRIYGKVVNLIRSL